MKLPNHFIFFPGLSQAASDPERPRSGRQLHRITSLWWSLAVASPGPGNEALLITIRLDHGQEGAESRF